MDKVKLEFTTLGLERNECIPCLYRLPMGRLEVEVHMDDLHGCAKKSEAERFLEDISKALKLKNSEPIVTGRYAHLKRTRIKLGLFCTLPAIVWTCSARLAFWRAAWQTLPSSMGSV